MSFRFLEIEEERMMAEWKEFSTMTKIFYIGGLVSFIGLASNDSDRLTSIGDILAGNSSRALGVCEQWPELASRWKQPAEYLKLIPKVVNMIRLVAQGQRSLGRSTQAEK